MTWHRLLLLILLSALLLVSVRAAESVRAFPGAGEADLARGLPADAFRLRLLPQREVIEGYNFWIQLDDVATMIVSLIVSNLGQTNQPAVAVSQVLVARSGHLLLGTGDHALRLNQRVPDAESGYAVPREVRSIISGDGMRLELSVPTDRYLHRIYMLEDLNPLLRAFIRAFIARPYVYRYRAPATVQRTRDGVTSRIAGLFVGELIFVNE